MPTVESTTSQQSWFAANAPRPAKPRTQSWFEQNAPKPVAMAGGWFAAHAPGNATPPSPPRTFDYRAKDADGNWYGANSKDQIAGQDYISSYGVALPSLNWQPLQPNEIPQSQPDTLDRAKAFLDRHTQDQGAGFFRRIANRMAQDIGGTVLDLATVKDQGQLIFDEQQREQAKNRKQHPIAAGLQDAADLAPIVPGIGSQIRSYTQSQHPVSDIAGDVLTGLAMERVARGREPVTPAELKQRAASLRPRAVTLAGESVPVLAGEASPTSRAGRLQTSVKRSGIGEARFDAVMREQQEAVKRVIRSTAQQTSGFTGPMPSEPGAAVKSAADATFAQARPMYRALDASLTTVPDAFANISKITEQAIERARKFGVDVQVGPESESVTINGRTFTPGTDPVGWENLKAQGLTPEASAGQPLSTYTKVRSELLKAQRSATDSFARNQIGNEVRRLNENMEATLKGSPLYDNWITANRLWAKGYALREVADAFDKTTKGTPASVQASGVDPVQTRIRAPQLVGRLNDLQRSGVLERAFSPEQASTLRQAADLLDRAAKGPGRSAALYHGYSPRSVFWRQILNAPLIPLVNAMTNIDGLRAVEDGLNAPTTQKAERAAARLLAIGAVTSQLANAVEAKRSVQQMRAAQ